MDKKRGNIKYLLKEWISVSRVGFVQAVLRIPIELLLPTLMAMIPKLLIDAVTAKVTDTKMLLLVGALTVFLVLLSVIQPYFYGKLNRTSFQYDLHFNMVGLRKILDINYQQLESFEGRKSYERARSFCGIKTSGGITAGSFIYLFSGIIVSVCGIFSYIVLFTVLQPYLVIILIISSLIEFFILKSARSKEVNSRNDTSSIFAKLDYFYDKASEPKSGKDVRLYGFGDKFCQVLAGLMAAMSNMHNKLFRKKLKLTFGQAVAVMIRDIASYACLIYLAVIGEMTLSNFIMYFGLLVGFSGWITGLASSINDMKRIGVECGKFRDFIEEPSDSDCAALPFKGELESIEFKDVCFKYEQAEENTLNNINFKLNINDRIAIVGENGAGKTTLIKLMCGLYKPTSGEILLNGAPIIGNLGKQYYELFATVFQDFYFLPLTILENISAQSKVKSDEKRALECLNKAGLLDKVNSLQDGLMSKMVRQVWTDAVDFSGGEQQRLLLARALYKDSPILILDEPTSALDPIAEQNIYASYKQFSSGKISIFISHRLASTQFCSKVFYMSNGEITEQGSHDDLLIKKGKYWSMFEAQSYYYKHAEKAAQGGQDE